MIEKIIFCIFWVLLLPIALLGLFYQSMMAGLRYIGKFIDYYVQKVSIWWEEKVINKLF